MLEIEKFHDCVKPDMIVGYETTTVKKFFSKKEVTKPVYENGNARYTCDECGAVWVWVSSLSDGPGFWLNHNRPSKWIKR